MRFFGAAILFLLLAGHARAQFEHGRFLVPAVLIGTDTVPNITLPTAEITAELSVKQKEALQQYWRLRYNVYKVYPYARFAAAKYSEINQKAMAMTDKERRRFIKDEESKAKVQFEGELKQLTFTQGRILIKLVDRETGRNSYTLVKELKGSFHAFLWQGVARIFGENLKWKYDSAGEDKAIEQVLREIESNQPQKPAATK